MNSKNVLDNYLVSLVKSGGRQAWAGKRMPFEMQAIDFANSTNYRVSSSLHQKFKVVWLYEVTVNDFKGLSWKIVLDEAIRLLGENGYIVVRMKNTDTISIPMVKAFLGRHIGVTCDISYETAPTEMEDTIVFFVNRKNIENYQNSSWTFGVLTMGDQVERVCKFLESVRKHDQAMRHEIIIVGPPDSAYAKYQVAYISPALFRDAEYAEVSKKKNAIIDKAQNPNLMIIHDRYVLCDNFFNGFDEYGYDFDFLAVKQYDLNDREFPSYCATNKKMVFAGQIQVNDYSKIYETQYVNGGVIIMKTSTARRIRFNSILFWAQMEDVELTQVAMSHSIVPRINFLSAAKTFVVKEGYFNSWGVDNGNEDQQVNAIFDNRASIKGLLIKYIAMNIPVKYKSSCLYQYLKRSIRH